MKSLCRNTVIESLPDLRVVSKVSRMCHGAWAAGIYCIAVLCLCLWVCTACQDIAACRFLGQKTVSASLECPCCFTEFVERMSGQQENASCQSGGICRRCCKASAPLSAASLCLRRRCRSPNPVEHISDVRQMHPCLFPLLKVVMSHLLWPAGVWQWWPQTSFGFVPFFRSTRVPAAGAVSLQEEPALPDFGEGFDRVPGAAAIWAVCGGVAAQEGTWDDVHTTDHTAVSQQGRSYGIKMAKPCVLALKKQRRTVEVKVL